MKKELNLEWRKNGKEKTKAIDREKFLNLMDSVKAYYQYDNEFSTKIAKIIPDIEVLRIDFDVNATKEDPFIIYYYVSDPTRGNTLTIKRRHKVVWSILESLCV